MLCMCTLDKVASVYCVDKCDIDVETFINNDIFQGDVAFNKRK